MIPIVLHHGDVAIEELFQLPDPPGVLIAIHRELLDYYLELL
jgi:hypothetical protein